MICKKHLVIVGFDEVVSEKYMTCINEAIKKNVIDSYTVIDIKPQKKDIDKRIRNLKIKPENVYYLSDPRKKHAWTDIDEFSSIFKEIARVKNKIIVYIAAELKAHESYLEFCINNKIDSLTEKPIIAPFENGKFDPSLIETRIKTFINKIKNNPGKHSAMSLSRYHKIYNGLVIKNIKEKIKKYGSPISSLHVKTAGGIWNLHEEYESREDHPYKYGYGALMHGSYHYIDLFSQIISLNKIIFPKTKLSLNISTFAAFPKDQKMRIPKGYSQKLGDRCSNRLAKKIDSNDFGETDLVATFCLKNNANKKTITLGSISFEQTTPSIRSWRKLPRIYNKNGRVCDSNIEIKLSTLYSISVNCVDVPIEANGKIKEIKTLMAVRTKANASLLKNEKYNTLSNFNGYNHSDSNRELITNWLIGKEQKSQIKNHLLTMKILQALAISVRNPGKITKTDI